MPRCISRGLVFTFVLAFTPLSAQLTEVIHEDFESGAPAGLSVIGTSQLMDDGCGNTVLSLTQGTNNQGGWAWLADQFDLSDSRVEIELDLFIGRSTSATPADGISVIFQFDGDLNARGDAGGGLGVGTFRQNNSPYVAVGFDIWDNGGVDVETPCDDGRYGDPGSCHAEVNQNIDPEVTASQATGPSPDYIASGEVYGIPPGNVAPVPSGTCDPADLIHVVIIFDNRLMLVKLSGGRAGDGSPFAEQTVINYATAEFPDRPSNIGFAASTGAANAHQWVDNVVVLEGPSIVTFVPEAPRTAGAINSAGPRVNATPEIGIDFAADILFGGELSRVGDIDTGLTITTSRFGRIQNGADFANVNTRPIDVSSIAGAGAETAKLFIDDAWSTTAVEYRAEVVPGRYDVSLFWAENFNGAINGAGQGTKLYDVYINGTKVLCNWSAASAAGSPTESGDPNITCNAVLDTGIRRNFSVSVPDGGGGIGTLDVIVDDLGGGNPPENAALNAISFHRTGDADGGPATGQTECIGVPPGVAPPGIVIEENFDAVANGECPAGMVCNNVGYAPQGLAGRLKMTDDTAFNTGNTAIFEQTVDVSYFRLETEFDVFMANPDAATPADGGAFFVMQGSNTNALGFGGGGIGIPFNGYGFAVEFDTWQGGGNNEPSGYNVGSAAFTHVGINNLSTDSTITNVQYDPDLKPVAFGGTGWPNFLDPEGVHFRVTYDAGHITVTLSGVNDDLSPFGPTVVAEADVPPIFTREAVVGFSGGTGGATQDLEIDNVVIRGEEGTPESDPLADAIDQARSRWIGQLELYINCGGPLLACSGNQFPAPQATGDAGPGDSVVWLPDLGGGGAATFTGEFFSVTPLLNQGGTTSATLQVAGTDMGLWDARGTSPGIDNNDNIFHTERWAAMQYDIPVTNGSYEVTLYFANSFSGTAGTARRVFHVDVEGERKDGFEHCEFSSRTGLGLGVPNPFFGFDTLFDPVEAAEALYSSDPCNFASCAQNGVAVATDPDADRIQAPAECGNAAAVALRYEVAVSDGSLTIALTPPDTGSGEPPSPDGNPKISGIAVKGSISEEFGFRRGDSDTNGSVNITDAVRILNVLFLGLGTITCDDAADTDDNGSVNITDAVRILNVLFLGLGTIPAPGPDSCGIDPTHDSIQCAHYPDDC
jgi:hypothetical protein